MNLLFQYADEDYVPMLDLVYKRHASFANKFGAWSFDETAPYSCNKFWQKWTHVRCWMHRGAELSIAADADVIWQYPRNIFHALPPEEKIGITWINGCPSSGVVWIRNCPEMRAFVDTVISMEDEFCRFPGTDQSAMLTAAERTKTKIYRINERWHGMNEDSVLRGFHCLPNRLQLMKDAMKALETKEDAARNPELASRQI